MRIDLVTNLAVRLSSLLKKDFRVAKIAYKIEKDGIVFQVGEQVIYTVTDKDNVKVFKLPENYTKVMNKTEIINIYTEMSKASKDLSQKSIR